MRSSQLNMLLILLLIIWIMTSLVCTYLLIERVKTLTEENRTLTESVTRLERAKTHLVKRVKQLAKEMDDFTSARSNRLSTIQELQDKIVQFTETIESLTESVTTLESEKTTLVDRTERLHTDNDELQQVQAMHEWMIHQLRYVNTGLIERIETLQNHTMHQDALISWLRLACDNQFVEEDNGCIGYRMAEAVLSSPKC